MRTLYWQDQPHAYGLVSRCLHWGMMLLFTWQFVGMACRLIFGRTPLVSFLVGTHASVGLALGLLACLRLLWAWYQKGRRPVQGLDWRGRLARFAHGLLYLLMIVVPTLALLRQYGGGRPLSLLGIQILERDPRRIEWMMAPANAMHGILAWTLLALIVLHVLAALVHRWWWRDDTLARMLGRPSTA